MSHSLTTTEIEHRLTEGRNYKRLYFELKAKYDIVVSENKQLKTELAELRQLFAETTETQQARIEELETMVFGRKPRGGNGGQAAAGKQRQKSRSASSYRRPIPKDEAVTSETRHNVSTCGHCGGPLTDVSVYIHYVMDIVLAAFSDTPLKTVEKQSVERGYCVACGQYSSALDLRGQDVSLGSNVRLFVTYLSNIQGLTYGQIRMLLQDTYDFDLADGEITAILDAQRQTCLPMYQELKNSIRAGPVHFDESRYRIQSEQGAGYAFVMAGADGSAAEHDVIFHLAASRGKGHASELAGPDFQSVGITDRYSAYKHLFLLHQICWAHLHRNARDLTHLECLNETKRQYVQEWYSHFSDIYAALRQCHAEPFDQGKRNRCAGELSARVKTLCLPDTRDPKKLSDLKRGMLEYLGLDALFVCLTVPGVPPDNNKAERSIRKLVLKRVRSFGVKTPKGARTLEVLLSICWSLWQRDRKNFFPNLRQLTQAA